MPGFLTGLAGAPVGVAVPVGAALVTGVAAAAVTGALGGDGGRLAIAGAASALACVSATARECARTAPQTSPTHISPAAPPTTHVTNRRSFCRRRCNTGLAMGAGASGVESLVLLADAGSGEKLFMSCSRDRGHEVAQITEYP